MALLPRRFFLAKKTGDREDCETYWTIIFDRPGRIPTRTQRFTAGIITAFCPSGWSARDECGRNWSRSNAATGRGKNVERRSLWFESDPSGDFWSWNTIKYDWLRHDLGVWIVMGSLSKNRSCRRNSCWKT